MKLFDQHQYAKLVFNGKQENRDQDHKPVVKLFIPEGKCVWLVNEIVDLYNGFGLCDLGLGLPQLGYFSIREIASYRSNTGLRIECDLNFIGKYPMSVYADAARFYGYIMLNDSILEQFNK